MQSTTHSIKAARSFNVEGTEFKTGDEIAAVHLFGGVQMGTLQSLMNRNDLLKMIPVDGDGEVDEDGYDDDTEVEATAESETAESETAESETTEAETTEAETASDDEATAEVEASAEATAVAMSDDTLLADVLDADVAELYASENVETRGELVEYLANGNKLTTPTGIGPKTAVKVAATLGL
ncbi:MAG: hypothetical protein WBD31_02030 [Rubripirellula sp.]